LNKLLIEGINDGEITFDFQLSQEAKQTTTEPVTEQGIILRIEQNLKTAVQERTYLMYKSH
jgi:hypothetical protein